MANEFIIKNGFHSKGDSEITGSTFISGSLNVTTALTASGNIYPTDAGIDRQVLKTDGLGNITFGYPEEIVAIVKNVSGTTLLKGTPVHATASGAMGNVVGIIAASASLATSMPATFILNETLADEAEGEALASGFIQGVNTSGFEVGQIVYVGENGGYTNVKPTGSNLIQNLGIVTKIDASNGSGYILGAGRSNDLPNLTPDSVWVGNSDSVPTVVLTSSLSVASASYALTSSHALPTSQIIFKSGSAQGEITLTPSDQLQFTNFGSGVTFSNPIYNAGSSVWSANTLSSLASSFTLSSPQSVILKSTTAKQIEITGSTSITGSLDIDTGVSSFEFSNYNLNYGSSLNINANNGGYLQIKPSGNLALWSNGSQALSVNMSNALGNSQIQWQQFNRAQVNIAASTEVPTIKLFGANKTWRLGDIGTQRYFNITGNTASFEGASTITDAYGLYVEETLAGTNATITNNYAIGAEGAISASTYYGDGSNLTGISSDPFPYTGTADINGNTTITNGTLNVTSGTGTSNYLNLDTVSSNYSTAIVFKETGTVQWAMGNVGVGDSFRISNSTTTLSSAGSAIEIIENRNVGIGTLLPSTKLHVAGTISGSGLDIAGSGSFAGKIQSQGFLFGSNIIGSLGATNRYISDGGDAQDFWFNVPTSGRYRFAINNVIIAALDSVGVFSSNGLDITGTADINGNTTITGSLNIYKSGSTVFNIEGSQGQLFSVTDELSGSLFSVNDISGIPILEVFSDDTVKIGTYNDEAIVVNGNTAIITGSFTGSFTGDGSGLTGISSFTVSGDTNNRVITADGAGNGVGEANLTFDGTTLLVTGDASITGRTTLGDASGDSVTINAATINTPNLPAGTDNTVLVLSATNNIVTDEIDSRVWGTTLVDAANGVDNRLATFTDSNSLNGEANLTFDGTLLDINGGNVNIGRSLGVGLANSGTSGRIDAANDVVAFSSSDKRWKTNIKKIESPLEKLQKLSGVEFDWIKDVEVHGNTGNDVGVIAQEVELVLPQAVQTRDSGMKAVRYEKLIPLLIETIKEQQKQIDDLKNKIG